MAFSIDGYSDKGVVLENGCTLSYVQLIKILTEMKRDRHILSPAARKNIDAVLAAAVDD